jgi:hypothetical protein
MFIEKIWKDSVWSKVISTGIIGLIVFLAAKLNPNVPAGLYDIMKLKIDLWIVLLLVAFVVFIASFVKRKPGYDDASITVDRNLFNKIRNDLEMTSLIAQVKSNSFSNAPVEIEQLIKLLRPIEENNRADFEFLNPELNKLKNNFIDALGTFELSTSRYLFGVKGNAGWTSIPSEWEYDQPERMEEAFLTLQRNENKLAAAYQEFISKGRSILKV